MIENNYDPYQYLNEPRSVPTMAAAAATADRVFTYPQNLPGALELMEQALSGESEDRMFYSWLMEQAPSAEDKQIITGIRDDEIGHFALFRQIYTELTGRTPPRVPEEPFTPPESYCRGLGRALLGEQNAVKKYRKILYALQSRVHINMLIEIITDELRHGSLYNYLYANNGCGGS
jgi:rubrerythrin